MINKFEYYIQSKLFFSWALNPLEDKKQFRKG